MWQPIIMVNSGAYIAYRQHKIIDLTRYSDFLLTSPHITTYVNLDFICPEDPQELAKLSFDNFIFMRERGLDPIPVYHVREHPDFLRRYVGLGCPWIGLAGSASSEESDPFFELCFNIREQTGVPVKFHAFGDSVRSRLMRYPFYSADGASWILRSMRYTGMTRWAQANDSPEQFANRVYNKARTYHRLQSEVRDDNPEFIYYFGCGTGFSSAQRWQVAALNIVRHQHAIVSYYGMSPKGAEMLKMLIETPELLLEQCTYRV